MSNYKRERDFYGEGSYRKEEEADENEYDHETDGPVRQFCFNIWQDIKEAAEENSKFKNPPTG